MTEPSEAIQKILDEGEYVDLDPRKSVLDGRFTADELRAIADEMDRLATESAAAFAERAWSGHE